MADEGLDERTKAQMGRVIWWVVGVAGLLLVMLVVFAITLNISRPSQDGPTVAGDVPEPPTPTPVPTATAEPTPTEEPTPSGVTTARAVQSALIEAGFTDVVASEGDTAGSVVLTGILLDDDEAEVVEIAQAVEGVSNVVSQLVTGESATVEDVQSAIEAEGLEGVIVEQADDGSFVLTGAVDGTEERNLAGQVAAEAAGSTPVQNRLSFAGLVPLLSEIISGNEDLSGLAGLADLEALDAAGPVTIFAPSNTAFAVATLPAEPEALQEILSYHIVPGTLLSGDLADGDALTTALGPELTISVDDDGNVLVNGEAVVVTVDLEGRNGVVHVIDAVLIPPA